MKNIYILPTNKSSRLSINCQTNLLQLGLENRMFHDNLNIYITSDEEIKKNDYALALDTNIVFKVSVDLKGIKSFPYLYKKIILTTNQDLIKDGVQAILDNFLEWFVKNPNCENIEIQKGWRRFDENLGYLKRYKIIIPKEEPTTFKNMLPLTKVDWEKFKKNPVPNKKEDPKQHVELINNNIKEFDKKIQKFKHKEKVLIKEDYDKVHLRHCYQGKYEDNCKYGEDDCPAKPKQETLEEANWKVLGTKIDTFYNGAKWQQERSYSEEEVKSIINTIMIQANETEFGNLMKFIDIQFEQFKKK